MTKKLLLLLLGLIVVLGMFLVSPVFASDLEKIEYYDTGGTSGSAVYGNVWVAQTFTTVYAHSVEQVKLRLYKAGSPGTITVGIRAVDGSGHPTGADLTTGTMDGDTLATEAAGDWYSISLAPFDLEREEEYAIVVRALGGDIGNQVVWKFNPAGSYSGGNMETSANGGTSWTPAATCDTMFEVWGKAALTVLDPKVFLSVSKEGDWLVVFSYKNTTSSYADGGYDPREYFNIEFRETATVKAMIKMPAWGYKPAAFYINAADAADLTWGGDYRIRLTGNPDKFDPPPYAEYTLVSTDSDWYGESLTWLEDWVIQTAELIGEYDEAEYTQYIEHHGEVLTSDGATIFTMSIPYLPLLVPDVFEYVVSIPGEDGEEWTNAGVNDPETMLGSDLMTALDNMGGEVNLGGQALGAFLFFVVYVGIGAVVYKASDNSTAAIVVPSPILIIGGYFGLIHLAIIATMGILALAALVYILWFRTA